jgi:hypothetical protein
MSQPTLRRYLTVGILAAVLTAANAAPAQARDLGTAGRAWTWLQGIWTQGVSALWDWNRTGEPGPKGVLYQEKQGPGLDPNGSTDPRPAAASPACGVCTDEGPGLDPNG